LCRRNKQKVGNSYGGFKMFYKYTDKIGFFKLFE
jgi:hypothetical protein